MGLFRRLAAWFVTLPVVVAIIALAVANRAPVPVQWNPLDGAAGTGVSVPLYVIAFVFFGLGALAGGFTVWNGQRRWRRAARDGRQEVRTLKSEVDRLKRDGTASGQPALSGPR